MPRLVLLLAGFASLAHGLGHFRPSVLPLHPRMTFTPAAALVSMSEEIIDDGLAPSNVGGASSAVANSTTDPQVKSDAGSPDAATRPRRKGPMARLRPLSRISNMGKSIAASIADMGKGITRAIGAFVGSFQPAIRRVIGLFISDPDVCNLVATFIAWAAWGSVLMSALGTVGLDIKPLLSLSTLAGFAISISTKNILSDTFSAAYVIWLRPFKRGDKIKIAGSYEGVVKSIDYHFVHLIVDGGKEVLMPTHSVYGKVVERVEVAPQPNGNRFRRA
jgi:hypothetical protein